MENNTDANNSLLSIDSADITTTPPSLAPLSEEFKEIKRFLESLENDQEWEVIITKLQRILELASLGLFNNSTRMNRLTQLTCINSFIITERTQLMSETLNFVQNLANTLKPDQFQLLLNQYLPQLIKNLGKTNKLFVKKSSITLIKLIQLTKNYKLFLTQFNKCLETSINKGQKLAITEVLLATSNEFGKEELEGLESCIKFSSEDSALEVRNISKKLFDIYSTKVDNEMKTKFIEQLSDNSKKTLKLNTNTRPSTSKLSIAELKRIKRAEQLNQINSELTELKVEGEGRENNKEETNEEIKQ